MKGFTLSQYFLGQSTFNLGGKLCKLNKVFPFESCKFNNISISSQLAETFSNQYPDVFITVETSQPLPPPHFLAHKSRCYDTITKTCVNSIT
jgi:hypothetical protein